MWSIITRDTKTKTTTTPFLRPAHRQEGAYRSVEASGVVLNYQGPDATIESKRKPQQTTIETTTKQQQTTLFDCCYNM